MKKMQCSSQLSAIDFNKRRTELLELSSYIKTVDNDVTMILQSLQWDRRHLIEATPMTSCRYDPNHRVPPDKLEYHEKECYLRSMGYSEEDLLLPEPLDANAKTLVTLNKNDIENIIDYAAKIDRSFKKGRGPELSQPLSLARLQGAYSADERRALHDSAVSAAPSCHDLNELALLGGAGEAQTSKRKSRAEILAELRDMKRRRTKYRGAAKTGKYSDVLRGVIATQMEHYSEAQNADTNISQNIHNSKAAPKDYRQPRQVYVKKEPYEQDKTNTHKYADKETRRISKEHSHRDKSNDEIRHRENHRDETRHTDRSRDKYKERERGFDDYKRSRDDGKQKDHRDGYSSSSKERSRDKIDYRCRERYRDDSSKDNRNSDTYRDNSRRKDYKDYKSSINSEKYKHKHDSREKSYTEENHKRYYDYKQHEYEVSKQRIKQEKD